MKNKLLTLSFALIAIIVTSCGNSSKESNDTIVDHETTINETIACENDTTERSENDSIVTRGGSASEGFGRCSKCNCKAFEGRGQTCRNCGHAYKAHY